MKKYNAKLADFIFVPSGYGHYKVTYQQPSGKKPYTATIDDMKLIDATKGTDFPKVKDLNELRRQIKKAQ